VISRHRLKLALVAALAALAACSLGAVPARAAGGQNPIITDCLQHPSGLTGHYTVSQLTQALVTMSPETKEYTSCPDVIARARLAAIAAGGTFTGSSGGSGSFLPTPVIVILVLLVLVAVTFGAIAIRRRRQSIARGDQPPAGPGSDEPPPGPSDG
jgi:hypothetical protein